MFGTRIDSAQDPLVSKSMEIGMEFMDLTGEAHVYPIYITEVLTARTLGVLSNAVDFIKPLQWFLTRTRTRARWVHDVLVDVYGSMILRVKAQLDANENVEDCLAKTLLLDFENKKLDWEDVCMLASVFTIGGVHSVCFLAQRTAYLESILTRSYRRLRVSFSGLLHSLRHIRMCRDVHTKNLTRSLEGRLGRLLKTRNSSRTLGQSSRKSSESALPSWCRRPIPRLRTLCTTGITYQRARLWCWMCTPSILTRIVTLMRKSQAGFYY